MADSKTGKKAALAAAPTVTKIEIGDNERVRLLRIEVASGIYPSSENTKALLREFDNLGLNVIPKIYALRDAAVSANEQIVADLRPLIDYISASPYGTPVEGEKIGILAMRVLNANDKALVELDKTATALEAARDTAEAEAKSLRDRVAELEGELRNINSIPPASIVPGE